MGKRLGFSTDNPAINWIQTACMTGTLVVGLMLVDALHSLAGAQQINCRGSMNNGWRYTAEYRDGGFTRIRWQRGGQPPQVSNLTYNSLSPQGHPVYTGAFQASTRVTLVDFSNGNVGPGSQISVRVEEWGTSTGFCGGRPIPAAW